MPTSNSQTAKFTKPTKPRTDASRCHWADSCFSTQWPTTPANISHTCPNVSAAKRVCSRPIDAHQLHCISMQEWERRRSAPFRARQMPGRPGHCTHGRQGTQSRPSQVYHGSPSLVLNPKEHAWTSCSTCADTRTTSTRQWSRHFPPTQDSSRQPAPAKAKWSNVKRRKSLTGTPASTWSRSSWRPRVDLATLRKSSSKVLTATLRRPRPGRHPDHQAQQYFQTTAPSRHHVTLVAPVPHHLTRPPPLLLFVAVGRVCSSPCLSWRLSLFCVNSTSHRTRSFSQHFFTCVLSWLQEYPHSRLFNGASQTQCPRHLHTMFTTLLTPPQQPALPHEPRPLPPQHQP